MYRFNNNVFEHRTYGHGTYGHGTCEHGTYEHRTHEHSAYENRIREHSTLNIHNVRYHCQAIAALIGVFMTLTAFSLQALNLYHSSSSTPSISSISPETSISSSPSSSLQSSSLTSHPSSNQKTMLFPKIHADLHVTPLNVDALIERQKNTLNSLPKTESLSETESPSKTISISESLFAQYQHYYKEHQDFIMARVAEFTEFNAYVHHELKHQNLPIELAILPFMESSYRVDAVSSQGAVGVWQLMPETAKRFGLAIHSEHDERRDLRVSTQGATLYLKWLYDYFDEDILLTVAAYNAGEGRIKKFKKGGPLPKETYHYVHRFLALTETRWIMIDNNYIDLFKTRHHLIKRKDPKHLNKGSDFINLYGMAYE
ncbi:lytic transglycosylase domain-containing protein [Vibrio sp.]|nr:lytic transglycosylase domain-containing protein [Vibrio sp.]